MEGESKAVHVMQSLYRTKAMEVELDKKIQKQSYIYMDGRWNYKLKLKYKKQKQHL